jgi:hypothetical protein
MGNNTHGNQNEKSLAFYLENKKYKDIANLNLKTFIKEIHPSITDNTVVMCPYNPGMKKQDIQILIGDKNYYVSVKTGSGNSIHQEKLEPFITLLKEHYNISDELANDIRFFVWGDGSLDGTGKKENRLSATQLKKQYPELLKRISHFFNEHKKELLNRFLVTGRFNGHIDYIYYGTPLNGVWCKAEDALSFHSSFDNSKDTGIKLGNTTFQTWNRCIKGDKKEKDRDTIQLKWGAIKTDITNIRKTTTVLNMGTQEGDTGEFDFCRELNRNKNCSTRYWKFLKEQLNLPDDLSNIYAIKVSNNVYSKLADAKVLPKTDIYLIEAKLEPRFLLLNNYLLDESLLKNIPHKALPYSGVSIKRPDSKKYSIQKLSVNSFDNLFNGTHLGAGASLYCNAKEISKNPAVIAAWGQSIHSMIQIFSSIPGINDIQSTDVDKVVNICKKIKTHCNTQIKALIMNNIDKSNLIFKGEGNFDEPYVAHFIFKNNELAINIPVDITITTGSGRSKGTYTIEIKPK